ncbi:MAG TPA: FAD-dependent oxidoreductase [Candidatus Elarobacter sp.]|jgi:thioredoxin reductase (NADPH)|nr:FAD-dependent oxidoreductase [Candidatus Elarobacter sp.]
MITAEELRSLPLFAALSSERLTSVSARAADMDLQPGEYLVHEGESPGFFVILDGTVEVTKRFGTLERVLGTRTRGDMFGEVPLILGAATFANARAATRARVMRLDGVTFNELVRESPRVSAAVMESIALRIGDLERVTTEGPSQDAVIVGRRYDPACHDVRDFLARNQVRFDWFEPDDERLHERIPDAPALIDRCPLVRTASGQLLVQPTPRELACAIGLPVDPEHTDYDLVIAGGGPAGLAAAVYGASEGLRTLMVEREAPGGQAGTSSRIENYLGFPGGLSGSDLGERALLQAQRLGAEMVVTRNVIAIEPDGARHTVRLDGNDAVGARAVLLANGVTWRRPPVEGIDALIGRGVYYGAARTEAIGTRGKDVYLLGGGNSAGQAALYFSDYARSVTLIVRSRSLDRTMSRYLVERIERRPDVFRVIEHGEVVAVEGADHLRAIVVRARDGAETRYATDSLFVFIGADPETGWLPDTILRDPDGYVLTGPELRRDERARWPLERDPFLLETSVPGIFAAGDVRHGSVKRVAAAVGEGSMAIAFVHQALPAPDPA